MYKHLPNGCMRWMVDNFAVELDPAGNVKPSKLKAGDKIDGVVAAIMALSRCFTVTQKKRPTLLGSA
jgi:phage terminase large subunit-like protein